MDLENHLLLWPAKKDRSSFPVVVMSQAEKWQDGAGPALLPEPINSPCGLRLVCTSPNRGIFNHIKSWSRKLRTRVWLALSPSLYLPVCLYTDWQQHTCHTRPGTKDSKGTKCHFCLCWTGFLSKFTFGFLSRLPCEFSTGYTPSNEAESRKSSLWGRDAFKPH